MILYMMSVTMTTFMNQLAIAETHNRVRFTMQSGVLSFWRRPENFALHLIHHILNVTYTLDVNLYIIEHPEVSEQPRPSPPPISICPVLSLVPFKNLVIHQIESSLQEFLSNFPIPFANALLSRVRSVATRILRVLLLDETIPNLFGFTRNHHLSSVVTFLTRMIPRALSLFGAQSIQ